MAFKNQALTLQSDALPTDSLLVTKVTGDERLSELFRFDIELLCKDDDVDLEAVLYAPARLGIQVAVSLAGGGSGTTSREIAGVFAEFEQQEKSQGWTRYRATLVPKAWLLTRTHRSRVFLDQTVDQIVAAALKDQLDDKIDFQLKLTRQGDVEPTLDRAIYPLREYVVQYDESDWSFVARWLEHEGIWFCFTNEDGDGNGSVDKIVLGDTTAAYVAPTFGSTFAYRPEAAGAGAESDQFVAEEVYQIRCRQTRLPVRVTVNDYDWRKPDVDLTFSANVLDKGTGRQTEYNDNFRSAAGTELAKVRAEERACRARSFHGESSCRSFRPGEKFSLQGHFADDFNIEYLLVAVHHVAEQMVSLESSTVTGVKYGNTFEAIPASACFRPARVHPWPSIKGVMHAQIDAEGVGPYAELDEYGRYKVRIPFDAQGKTAKDGRVSCWVRMAQPYAGVNSGMHFPLLKDAEVLLAHIDGDPDRPVIASAVPNARTPSPTIGANQTVNSIYTTAGNTLQIDDNAAASGFVRIDAARSVVEDGRWRSSVDWKTLLDQAGASFRGGPATQPGLTHAWREFFDGPAMQRIANDGRYRDSSGAGVKISDANTIPELTRTLDEANVVRLFNYLLARHTGNDERPAGAPPPVTPSPVTIDTLISNKAHKFVGKADGSKVEVQAGDTITFSIGDRYDYKEGDRSVEISTGGYAFTEVFGDDEKKEIRHGKVDEVCLGYGRSWKGEFEFWGAASVCVFAGLQSETEVKLGGYNSNEVQAGAVAEIEMLLGGKGELQVNGAACVRLELGKKVDFEVDKTWAVVRSDELKLTKLQATLTNKCATVIKTAAGVSALETTINDQQTTIAKVEQSISEAKQVVNNNATLLNETRTVLSETTTALNKNLTVFMRNSTAMTSMSTAGVTMIQ